MPATTHRRQHARPSRHIAMSVPIPHNRSFPLHASLLTTPCSNLQPKPTQHQNQTNPNLDRIPASALPFPSLDKRARESLTLSFPFFPLLDKRALDKRARESLTLSFPSLDKRARESLTLSFPLPPLPFLSIPDMAHYTTPDKANYKHSYLSSLILPHDTRPSPHLRFSPPSSRLTPRPPPDPPSLPG